MPASIFSETELARFASFPEEIPGDDLIRAFTLTGADQDLVEPPTFLGAEVTETSVARDPLLVFGDRLTSPSVLLNESRVDPELHARE